LEGADGGNWGAAWSAAHWPVRAPEAVVAAGYAVGAGNPVTTGADRLADADDEVPATELQEVNRNAVRAKLPNQLGLIVNTANAALND
jgi:hypothetical protein